MFHVVYLAEEEEADWLDFVAYTRRKNVTNPWSLYFLYEIKKR